MSGEPVPGFEAMGFSADDAWLLSTIGLIAEDLDGWNPDDAVTLARAINHQGLDALMAEFLYTHYRGKLRAAFKAVG